MRKSISRESRWRIARICKAPSDGFITTGGGAEAGLGAARRDSPRAEATSSGRTPLNNMAKKLRNARIRRSNLQSPIFQNTLGEVEDAYFLSFLIIHPGGADG